MGEHAGGADAERNAQLMAAAGAGDVERVRQLVDEGAGETLRAAAAAAGRSRRRCCSFQRACWRAHPYPCRHHRSLVTTADPCFQDESDGASVLMRAAGAGSMEAVEFLLARGAPWNALDRAGMCAGEYAMHAGHQVGGAATELHRFAPPSRSLSSPYALAPGGCGGATGGGLPRGAHPERGAAQDGRG